MGSMENKKRYDEYGFTLMELLVVIAIIAILSSILVPSVRKAMESARRTRGANNMRQVAMAFMNYSSGFSGELRTIPVTATTAYAWAKVLADAGVLNETAMFLWRDDPILKNKELPKTIKGTAGTSANGWGNPSVVMLAGIDPYAPATTTPIAWTRGLNLSSGNWENGIYGNEGGLVAFLDGHVEWFENTTDKFVKALDDSACTSPIEAATTDSGAVPIATTPVS
jgi:prepilin-type N-terminal cleavage/methylation domain-containing protein/prepilin-type processing-associated H-X9-DG protein